MFFQVRDIISLHSSTCPSCPNARDMQLSLDGVSESKSTSISLDVYSMKFDGCKTIYPLRIIRLLKKTRFDHAQQLNYVINDLHDNGCQIKQFVGDNPKRSNVKQVLGHSSWFPCEYCFSKGTKLVTNTADIVKKRKQIETQRNILASKINESNGAERENLKKH